MHPIAAIELAIIDRLKRGMGRMVRDVCSYGGELDGDVAEVIRALPCAWVTFGGVLKTAPYSTSRSKYKADGRFVVIVGDRAIRSDHASRHGGARPDEVGTYPLLYAVRYLLSNQDLGLKVSALQPGRIRTLFNTKLNDQALSVFACEFDVSWLEETLPNNTWPAPQSEADDAQLFAKYSGELGIPDPDWLTTHLGYDLTNTAVSPDVESVIQHEP